MEGGQGSSKGHNMNAVNFPANFPFSQQECQEILGMLNKNKTSTINQVGNVPNVVELSGKAFSFGSHQSKENVWILDSGASDHIVYNPSLLTSLTPVDNRYVKLPYGTLALVTHIGKIIFSPNFVLHDVICVPHFYLNLISISKLASDSFYVTIFLKQFCVIHDLQSEKMIGT